MPNSILGINDNVEPNLKPTFRQRRNTALSEESASSTESDDYDRNAFHVFHQFGALMYYKGDFQEDWVKAAMNDTDEWANTGFAVVSDVTTGSAVGFGLNPISGRMILLALIVTIFKMMPTGDGSQIMKKTTRTTYSFLLLRLQTLLLTWSRTTS